MYRGRGRHLPGHVYVARSGRGYVHQIGIHTDEMIPGLSALVKEVHQKGSKIFFQLSHAGRQTKKIIAEVPPMGPSAKGRDPLNFVKPREMSEHDILMTIEDFAQAAKRAVKAGADGIQIFAAHGFLINQFLSPFFNHRNDSWGRDGQTLSLFGAGLCPSTGRDSSGNFRHHQTEHPRSYARPRDHSELAKKYVQWLVALGLDGAELSSGTAFYCIMDVCRGGVPNSGFGETFPTMEETFGEVGAPDMGREI